MRLWISIWISLAFCSHAVAQDDSSSASAAIPNPSALGLSARDLAALGVLFKDIDFSMPPPTIEEIMANNHFFLCDTAPDEQRKQACVQDKATQAVMGYFQVMGLAANGQLNAQTLRQFVRDQNLYDPFSAEYTIPIFSYVDCSAKWYESCTGSEKLRVPAHMQACRVDFKIATRRGKTTGYDFKPAAAISGDTSSPARFRGYDLAIQAYGSHNVFDQVSARMRLENVNIIALPIEATVEDRQAHNCDHVSAPTPDPRTRVMNYIDCLEGECNPQSLLVSIHPADPSLLVMKQDEINARLDGFTLQAMDGSVTQYDFPRRLMMQKYAVPAGKYIVTINATMVDGGHLRSMLKVGFRYLSPKDRLVPLSETSQVSAVSDD